MVKPDDGIDLGVQEPKRRLKDEFKRSNGNRTGRRKCKIGDCAKFCKSLVDTPRRPI
jgi:hypothetical protein